MAGCAAGGFLTRAFESMLKECSGKKYRDTRISNLEFSVFFKCLSFVSSLTCHINGIMNSSLLSEETLSLDFDMEPDDIFSSNATFLFVYTISSDTSKATNQEAASNNNNKSSSSKDKSDDETSKTEVDSDTNTSSGSITKTLENAGQSLEGDELEIVLNPLRLAFETKNPKVIELALDCIHKLIAYDHLEGDPGLEDGKNVPLFTDILNMVCSCVDNNSPDSTILQVLKVLLTAVSSTKFRVHGEPLMGVIRVSSYGPPTNKKSDPLTKVQETSIDDDSQMLTPTANSASVAPLEELQNLAGGNDIKGLEAALDKAVQLEDDGKTSGADPESMSIAERDALLVFRTLCKMSMKEDNDAFTTKTRILSLELLQIEIGIFFPLIVLRSLDSSECPLNLKLMVIRMLEKICKDPQLLIDIYVNYDCDFEAPNSFERMVTTLSKIAQGTQDLDPNSVNSIQNGTLKGSSLQCLVNVLKSLVDWENMRRESKQNKDKQSVHGDVPPGDSKAKDNSNFEKVKAQKSTMEAAISEFNRHPARGIGFLTANRLVENTPTAVAMFLRTTSTLDKTMIGDYLGQHEDFPLAVMHAYVDSMNFSGMKFHTAIREFLKGFRLPGEAQKIDRIMEKYAERYCADNPGLFKSADTAYVLAYAVIMLNTDAHNPMVWPKMSKSDFVRMNATNDPEECGPTNLLEEIYDSIVTEEIKMKDDNVSMGKTTRQKTETDEKAGGIEREIKARVALCMEGFKAGIYITHVLRMDTMRYAFLTSLVRFTFLHAPRDMTNKNVEALRTLLDLCDSHPDTLQDTWNAVLECISRLEYTTFNPAMAATVMHGANQMSRDAIVHSLKELAGRPAEQVFLNSVRLPSESVVEFFTALCNISSEELKQNPARTYSLQKLVEISYYNMARIRMVWARIWYILSNHFISAGNNHDEKIAMYAIDSLRQLGIKYLEHEELANFTFQNDILKPFVILMRNTRAETIRKLIVDCTVQMTKSKVGSIKSGWRSVFMVFTAAANDEMETIVESAFENVEQVILEHFDQVVGDCFMDCVNCLISFANSKSSHRISLKAIALLRICEDRLAEGLIPGGILKPINTNVDSNYDITEHYWFPMLAGLSDLTSDPRHEVSKCALEVLFDLLNERGGHFTPTFWESIFHRVLFPIFDHVRHAGKESSSPKKDGWLRETSVHSLQLLCNLFNTFYKDVYFMLSPLLNLLVDCAKKTDQSVVSISLGALVHLIEVGGHQFIGADWDTLLKSIRDASYTTQPLELLNALNLESTKSQPIMSGGLKSQSQSQPENSPLVMSPAASDKNLLMVGKDHQDDRPSIDPQESEGQTPSSKNAEKSPHNRASLQRTQTVGQRLMGNMRDSLLVRSFTSKPKNQILDALIPPTPSKAPELESESEETVESPFMGTIRSKCITQLLLLGALDIIQHPQKKYWCKLKGDQKITILEILFSMLDFAASYNSYNNLRPPLNLLRQELTGTCIYLDALQKTTSFHHHHHHHGHDHDHDHDDDDDDGRVRNNAEEKLASFCGQVLKEASDFQTSIGDSTNMEIHQVLELRSPILVKVLKGMCSMDSKIFRRHLESFYPLITKLVCCDQMDVRCTQIERSKRDIREREEMGSSKDQLPPYPNAARISDSQCFSQYTASLKCLEEFSSDKSKCQEHFDIYKECKKKEREARLERNRGRSLFS
ncbi:hypothetical protein L1887_18447 [Cichorium endivia]|nr:hypothetical protein L1887_18447 [Cichorium endivia]